MNKNKLTVREISEKDIPHIADYWYTADAAYLAGMGVDTSKMPEREQFTATLKSQLKLPYNEKRGYALIWEVDGEAVGHCNVNPIVYGKEASMHLHMWKPHTRRRGLGAELVQLSLPWFFKNLQLEQIYSEPYALNPAPHRTLEKAGFTLVKEYVTTPGAITFEQLVGHWEIRPK